MDFSVIPALGRNGVVNLARKISGNVITGFRQVDPTATFVVGQVAKLAADANGNPIVNVCTNSASDIPVGIFWSHKTVSFYVPVVDEVIAFTGSGSTVNLAHANLKGSAGSYVRLSTTANGGTDETYTTDYTVNYTNGTVTHAGAGSSIGATATVYVSYMYKDPNQSGIDTTLGAGKVVLLEDKGEIATRVYDTKAVWALTGNNGLVVVGADGVPTTRTIEGSAVAIGKVTKVPNASDPELCFKFSI